MRVLRCRGCGTTLHRRVESEIYEGPAWRCEGCLVVRESAETTLVDALRDEPLRM